MTKCLLWSTVAQQQRKRYIETIHSQHQLYSNPHHHNSCFECLKLDVMDSPLNCFYQRFVTYLVWRSLKRPVKLLSVVMFSHDVTLSALRTTECLKFGDPALLYSSYCKAAPGRPSCLVMQSCFCTLSFIIRNK